MAGKALVLSGGGWLGVAWELGVLRGLEDGGIAIGRFDKVVGTSAGAIVGAIAASGGSLDPGAPGAPRDLQLAAIVPQIDPERMGPVFSVLMSGGDADSARRRQIGAIFHVPERAEALVSDLQRRAEALRQQRPAGEPARVFLYDSGTDQPFTSGAQAAPDALISLAGGRNIFSDLDQRWTTVGWEDVVRAAPEVIVANSMSTTSCSRPRSLARRSMRSTSKPTTLAPSLNSNGLYDRWVQALSLPDSIVVIPLALVAGRRRHRHRRWSRRPRGRAWRRGRRQRWCWRGGYVRWSPVLLGSS